MWKQHNIKAQINSRSICPIWKISSILIQNFWFYLCWHSTVSNNTYNKNADWYDLSVWLQIYSHLSTNEKLGMICLVWLQIYCHSSTNEKLSFSWQFSETYGMKPIIVTVGRRFLLTNAWSASGFFSPLFPSPGTLCAALAWHWGPSWPWWFGHVLVPCLIGMLPAKHQPASH